MARVVCMSAGFLLAVLWFDLMFDVQAAKHPTGDIPAEVRRSISAYYARVTTAAAPRSKLIVVMMLTCLVSVVVEVMRGDPAYWRSVPSLAMAVVAVGIAKQRTVPNAVRVGRSTDDATTQSALIRRIHADHRLSFVLMAGVLMLHIPPG